MDLKIVHDINNNVFSTKITIDTFGTEQLSEDDEKELLSNFTTKIRFKNLTFEKHVKMVGSVVTVCEDTEGVNIKLPALSNKEIVLDPEFSAEYRIDTSKIPPTVLDANVITTKELAAEAYCIIFDEVIKESVENEMIRIRNMAPSFEGEEIISV